jgi:hypothetical protein
MEKSHSQRLLLIICLVLVGATAALLGFALAQHAKKMFGPSHPLANLSTNPFTTKNSETVGEVSTFAPYVLQPTSYMAAVPSTVVGVNEATNITNFEQTEQPFTAAQRTKLSTDNFVIRPNLDNFYNQDPDTPTDRNDDWTALYQKIGGGSILTRAPQNSVFISSDYLLHVYHRLLSKELEYVEQTEFLPKLLSLSSQLLDKTIAQQKNAQSPEEKASYDRLMAYFAVPTAMLTTVQADLQNQTSVDTQSDTQAATLQTLDGLKTKISAPAYEMAKQEIALIFAHSSKATPPLFAQPNETENLQLTEDYTQYTPRSHYAKNALLRSYFRTMMWYGRTNFVAKSPSLTRDALHITQLMSDNTLQKSWRDIYDPTVFIVGQSDDLGFIQYNQVLEKATISSSQISADQVTNAQALIKSLPTPQIMSSIIVSNDVLNMTKDELQATTQGFRLFGQRFTPDAFIFSTLTQGQEKPDPETGERLPSSTTALLVMSAMGNKTADQFLPQWITENAPDSAQVLNNRLNLLKNHFAQLSDAQWTQNLYWSWLFTLRPLATDYQSLAGYPFFMKTANWKTKNLQAALGSWTELKHDTLLYAKQSYAELGGGGGDQEIPPVPKGYVEPNIELLDRLLALSKMTQAGLSSRNLLPQEFEGRHQEFEKAITFFRDIAVKQLANQTITDDDFETLRTKGGSLSSILSPLPNEQSMESNARAALIADVHTDAVKNEILYEANAIPDYIYIIVKDANGARLTKGLTFSQYEFTGPLGTRETDQTWQAKIYTPNKRLPARPFWTQNLIVP